MWNVLATAGFDRWFAEQSNHKMKKTPLEKLLTKHMAPEVIDRAKRPAADLADEMDLAEIRKALNISQRGLARKMKVAQPTLAKIEKQPDMQIATLRKVVRALGGDIDIIAKFPKAKVRVRLAG